MPKVTIKTGGRLEVGGSSLLRIGTVPSESYNSIILGDSPIGYWTLDDTSGTVVTDLTGSNNAALVDNGLVSINEAPLVTDGGRSHIYTNPSTTNASVSYSEILNSVSGGHDFDALGAGGTDFAVEGWLSCTTTSSGSLWYTPRCIIELRSESPGRNIPFSIGEESGNLMFGSGAGSGQRNQSTTAINDGSRHHFVVNVTAGTSYEIFIDGVSAGTGTPLGSGAVSTDVTDFQIGTRATDSGGKDRGGFNGTLDNIAVYDKRLTNLQVTTHFNAG